MPPRHPSIASALGLVRRSLRAAGSPRRLLVACSGGADSTALVGLLHLLARDEALALIVAHVDHGLRRESADEAAAVARAAAQRGLASVATRLSLSPGSGLPARAREARRAALCAFASAHACDAIALGHTATDQAETLLMHAARGCGLEGLAAMRPWEAPWLRPLLELPRAATRALCERMALPFVDDPTNADEEQPRVRVRERVLPELRDYNPRVEAALVCLATRRRRGGGARRLGRARGGRAAARSCHSLVDRRPARLAASGSDPGPAPDLRPRGADLGALRAAVIEDIDRAVLARAAALGGTDAVLRPHVWHLRPGLHVRLDRQGLTLAGTAPGAEIPAP
ncbi:tRNA lysidine(34) synthetase TilS [Nannocystis pusilla]|uniref:tRNA lysidine(34) synthetase TilS n=1 Tax=Nannocystis pusilla TaxID=889268 RepID=UPI003B7A47C7